jgi:hypothetical protein
VYEINREISAHPFSQRAAPTRDLITTTQYQEAKCESFYGGKKPERLKAKGYGAECK